MSNDPNLAAVQCPACHQAIAIPLAAGVTTFNCPLCGAPFEFQSPALPTSVASDALQTPVPSNATPSAAPIHRSSRRWSGGAVLLLSMAIMLILGGGLAGLAFLSPSSPPTTEQASAEWIDATWSGVTLDGVTVRVLGVEVGPVRAKNADGTAFVSDRQDYWTVRLRIRNGRERPTEYRTWHAAEFPGGEPAAAVLRDANGARFVMQQFEDVALLQGQTLSKRLAPRESTLDVIVFAAPEDFDREALTELRLELPGAACQVKGAFRQSIPKSLVE